MTDPDTPPTVLMPSGQPSPHRRLNALSPLTIFLSLSLFGLGMRTFLCRIFEHEPRWHLPVEGLAELDDKEKKKKEKKKKGRT